ncbi:MAG: hypothetical protein JXB29_03920 [Sedimentisphaerales bacterium]|nr:hypothetical protein [Sedimentisphaerales bacterium]
MFFERAVSAGGQPKQICNFITQSLLKLANEKNCTIVQLGIPSEKLVEMDKMIQAGKLSAGTADTIIPLIAQSPNRQLEAIAAEHNLIQQSDAEQLEVLIDQVLTENPKAVEDVAGDGKKSKKALNFLLGQVMQKTKGRANPKVASEILSKKLS